MRSYFTYKPTDESRNFKGSYTPSHLNFWAVVVAQLAEQSLLTPAIRGLNPNIGKYLSVNCVI